MFCKKRCFLGMTIITAVLTIVSLVYAHHSNAGIDTESVMALEGTVTEFVWRNPHVYVLRDC